MYSVQTGTWDPHPPSKHASPVPVPPPSNSRLAHVTSAVPAKRITFYKSGDSQFGGVRMAIHKRSFKCFDALLDDLSQKVPLPFGVRTVTTPRGTHTIKHLEQFQDGGCYLCSDQRHAKPIDMELATKRANIWYHHGRRPHRPETSSSTPPGHLHLPYRQRRILLVKNSEPGVRRSVVLNRRSTRSLRAFLDEVSEVMQFHVRKLYTVEGRKIDNVQSLMTCPGVLVCVGREAFSPMLVNFIRKSSEEKMPGLGPRTPGNGARSPGTQGARSPPHGAQSRASECSEGLDSKKNVNFGLETKKSIIHPRSESSNRSARFSLSSEKSYSNGISAYSQARPAIMNDDIEKRVLVNKDGSLSVEMRVRFRLHNDESLQWSTQIKKSPSLTNESCPLSEAQPNYLQQGQSESCSDPDCTSFDPEGMDYSSQQGTLEVNHCPCCYQRQEQKYDLWENPAHSHKHPPHPPAHSSSHTHTMVRHTHSSSSSSSCNSRRVVRCRARLSSCGGGSASEQSQLVQEEMCLTEQVEHRVEVEQHGNTHVEVCKVSQSCNRSEVVTVESNHRPLSGRSECELMMAEEERPLSAVSSSSRVLQSLKEDPDDEDDSLPPSASRCCNNCELSPAPTPESQRDKPNTSKSEEDMDAEEENKETPRAVSGLSVHTGISKKSSSVCPNCGGGKRGESSRASQTSNHSEKLANGSEDAASDDSVVSTQSNKTNLTDHGSISAISNVVEKERAVSSLSVKSGASSKTAASVGSHKSNCQSSTKAESQTGNTDGKEEETNKRPSSCLSVKTNASAKSGTPDRPASGLSAKSNISAKSSKSHKSTCSHCTKPVSPVSKAEDDPIVEVNGEGEEGKEEQAESVISAKSNMSIKSNQSNKSNKASNEERALSQMSGKSTKSVKSTNSSKPKCNGEEEAVDIEIQAQQRPKSGMSGSAGSSKSQKCNCNGLTEASSDTEEGEKAEERAATALSGKSASSAKVEGNVESASSVISGRSHNSAKSSKSRKSNYSGASQNAKIDTEENLERVASVMSAKSKSSMKSTTSNKSKSTNKPSSPNVVTINTPEEEDNETKSNHNGAADIPAIETTDEEEKVVDDDVPKSISSQKSRGQTLSPRGARSPRSNSSKATSPTGSQSTVKQLSPVPGGREAKSPTSVKSGRSKCCCGAAKKGEDGENVKSEGASERAASILSTSSKRPPASQNSLGSVSLGLPEEQDTADSESGKSSVSICRDTGSKVRTRVRTITPDVPKSPEEPTLKQESEKAESTKSQKSNNNDRNSASSRNIPVVDIPTIETPEGGENRDEEGDGQSKERAASAISAKSSRSHKSSCSCGTKEATQKLKLAENDPECESVKSASTAKGSNLDAPKGRTSSAMSSVSAKVLRKSPANKVKVEEEIRNNTAEIDDSQSPCCVKPDSVISAKSEVKSKASKQSKTQEATKLDYLHPVKSHKAKSNTESDNGSVKTSSSKKKPSNPCPVHSKVEACSESTLSAADLLKENMATARPHSQQSKASKTSKKSDHCKKSRNQEVLTPACLPNASPTEVVSDWLRSIPANSSMFAPDDVLNDEDEEYTLKEKEEETPVKEVAETEESPEDEKAGEEEKPEPEEEESKEDTEVKCDEAEGKTPAGAGETSQTSVLRLSGDPQAKNWQSSAAVMKVLLNSSLGRCQSLPEVSPVYGRRLSTSAHRLLDCLAQLQLIEPAVNPTFDPQKDHNRQYDDIMAILHSLWLIEPRVVEGQNAKDGVAEQVTPPMSSSGVGMSSSSGGSGKDNGNQGGDETPPNKAPSPQEDEAVQTVVEGEEGKDEETKPSTEQAETNTADEQEQTEDQSTDPQSPDSPKTTNSPSSLDKSSANDDYKSPTDNEQEIVEDSSSGTPPTVLRAPLSKKLSQDPDPVWVLHLLKKLEKQFMSHYIDAMTEFKVRWDLDDSVILDTMICELREEVSRRIQTSVEREVKKIQGRAGRAKRSPRPPQLGNISRESTMTDKRRRILKVMKNQSVKTGDSVSDGEMTGDFSDQRSDDEYCPCEACVRKKMAARPLKTNPLAAEAPVMMEFDLLKILQLKKSPIPTPPVKPQPEEVEEESVAEEEKERSLEVVQEEEEEFESKEDAKAEETIAEEDEGVEQGQDEEEAKKKEEEPEDGEKEESCVGDEEQVEEETGGEGNEENEIEETGEEEEDEEEEEGECQCHATNKEESDQEVDDDEGKNTDEEKAGEEEEDENENAEDEGETGENEEGTGTGENEEDEEEEEEEESDNNTVKEVSFGEGENTKNAGEEKEEEEECEECKASESKEEDESDGAGQDTTNDESTPAEELAEENVSASAEDEEEEEGTAEGETNDDEKEGEDEEKQGEASEEENKEQDDAPCVTEGEEADGEDSDTDSKRQSDTGAEETGGTGDEEEEKEAVEDDVKEFKPEEDEEAEENKGEDGALLHQVTRTSVESQPGSLEDVDSGLPSNPPDSINVPKVGGGGGAGNRRSRSPARVKRRKPRENDDEDGNF